MNGVTSYTLPEVKGHHQAWHFSLRYFALKEHQLTPRARVAATPQGGMIKNINCDTPVWVTKLTPGSGVTTLVPTPHTRHTHTQVTHTHARRSG
jgi:hypothetical protein